MRHIATKIMASSHVHKVSALLIGIAFWSIVSALHEQRIIATVPLYVYRNGSIILSQPHTVTVTIQGKREDLSAINVKALAAHIDERDIIANKGVVLTSRNLFLPKQVKLLHYTPTNLMVEPRA